MLALMFQVAHVVEEAAFPVLEKGDQFSKVSQGWAATKSSASLLLIFLMMFIKSHMIKVCCTCNSFVWFS